MTQEQLIEQFAQCKKAEKELREKRDEILRELKSFCPHHIGEIIRWKDKPTRHSVRGISYIANGNYKEAVLTKIEPNIHVSPINGSTTFGYSYTFSPIKKDGEVSRNSCYVSEYEWTGELHHSYRFETISADAALEWADKLLAEDVNIGDVVTVGETSVKVVLRDDHIGCSKCAFNQQGDCYLYSTEFVTPCSSFNNAIGKPVIYQQVK
jgi:hypothetical protein